MLISSFKNIHNNNFYNFNKSFTRTPQLAKDTFVSFYGTKKTSNQNKTDPKTEKLIKIQNTKNKPYKCHRPPVVSQFNSVPSKVILPSHVASDVKEYEVMMVNKARKDTLNHWFKSLEEITSSKNNSLLRENLREHPDLKLFVLSSLTTSLQDSNRIIPSPFDEKALEMTVQECFFDKDGNYINTPNITPTKFMSIYNSTLVNNTLSSIIENPNYKNYILYEQDGTQIPKKPDLSADNLKSIWVKIPKSQFSMPSTQEVAIVENLSNPNWCTRSRFNKASEVIKDGHFYVYLERNAQKQWSSKAAITTYNGKISQIQGKKNDNFIPLSMRNIVATFLSSINAISSDTKNNIQKNLKCESGYNSELPFAYTQLLISQKLAQTTQIEDTSKTTSLSSALKNQDSFSALKVLYPAAGVIRLENGKISIGGYKPIVHIDKSSFTVPIALFDIDENFLLENVEEVRGNINISDSKLDKFPPSLKRVGGKLTLSKEQYESFGEYINENFEYKSITEKGQDQRKVFIISELRKK